MTVAEQVHAQRDFSAGQIDEEALRRDDADLHGAALRKGRNVELVATGGFRRRPGTEALFFDSGVNFWARPVSGKRFKITLGDESFTARLVGETVHTAINDCPWSADMVAGLTWQPVNRDIVVCHADGGMRPQIFRYDETADAWTRHDFAFRTGLNGAPRQPYFRFGGEGVTLTPSGRTGSITVTASEAYFVPGHVGVHFLYGGIPGRASGRCFEVTGYTSPTQVSATVIEELPPTYTVEVDDVSGFQVGQVVEGEESGCVGEIVSINTGSDNMTVLVAINYAGFIPEETVTSPTGSSETPDTSHQASASPAAARAWSEAFMSSVRGWPGSVSLDIQRLMLTRFPQLKNAALWSAISVFDDFLVTGEVDGAIFETIADDVEVYHIMGGYDQFAFTDRGIYYIPVTGNSPLVAGSVEFRKIESDGASPVRPAEAEGGHIFTNAGGTSILAIRATGQTARPYQVMDISSLHRNLIRNPVALAVTTSEGEKPERYLYAVNSDGTMAVARYDRGAERVGWVPWDTDGRVVHAFGQFGDLLVTVERSDGAVSAIEQLRHDLLLDGARFVASGRAADALEVGDGFLELGDGGLLDLGGDGALLPYAGMTVALMRDDERYFGSYVVAEDGTIPDGPADEAFLWAGFNYAFHAAFFVPGAPGGNNVHQRMRRRRVARSALTVHKSQGGYVFHDQIEPAWRVGENQEGAPPIRSETVRRRRLGRSFDPQIELTQTFPARLHVLEVAMEAGV